MVSAIAPITGRFRARVVRDIIGACSLGTVFACAWYYGESRPRFNKYREFNEKYKTESLAEEEKWMKENNYSRQ